MQQMQAESNPAVWCSSKQYAHTESTLYAHTHPQRCTHTANTYRHQIYAPWHTHTHPNWLYLTHTFPYRAHTHKWSPIGAAVCTWKITILLTRQHQLSAWGRRERRARGEEEGREWWKRKRDADKATVFCQQERVTVSPLCSTHFFLTHLNYIF